MEDALFECRCEQNDEYIKDNINFIQLPPIRLLQGFP